MRLDLLLVRLRFAKSRALARRWAEEGHIRCNGVRITSGSAPVEAGQVLTLPLCRHVCVIRIDILPERRGPAAEARSHYSILDEDGAFAIAGPASPTPAPMKDTDLP